MYKPRDNCQSVAVKLLVLTTTGLLVGACDNISWTGPTDVDQSPSGFYSGSFTSTDVQPSPDRQAIGAISEDFDAQFLLADQHYAGIAAVNGTLLSGSLTEYRGRQGVFVGFDGQSTVSYVGEVTERDGMFGTYEGVGAEGRFGLTYSSAYEDGSLLDRLAGIWSYSESLSGGGIYTITLDLDDNGQLFATDTAGCAFNGQLTIIDGRYIAYRAAVSVSTCGEVNGDYSGLAFYPSPGAADFLYFGTDNGQFAFAIQFERL